MCKNTGYTLCTHSIPAVHIHRVHTHSVEKYGLHAHGKYIQYSFAVVCDFRLCDIFLFAHDIQLIQLFERDVDAWVILNWWDMSSSVLAIIHLFNSVLESLRGYSWCGFKILVIQFIFVGE